MNTETGQIYRDPRDIEAALKRGEPLTRVSDQVADIVEAGHAALNRAQRREAARNERLQQKKRANYGN